MFLLTNYNNIKQFNRYNDFSVTTPQDLFKRKVTGAKYQKEQKCNKTT